MSKASGAFLLAFFLSMGLFAQDITFFKALNSVYDEQHVVQSPSGDFVFSVGFHPDNSGGVQDAGDIWISKKNTKGVDNKPLRLPALSTASLDVPVGFLSDNNLLVYHGGSVEKAQGIYHYRFNGRNWVLVEKLKIRGFINSSTHFSGRIHNGGNVLIMSLQDQRSLGNEDLYVSIKGEDGWWSTPENMGTTVNTKNQEITPFLSSDGKILYFSSNRASGKHIYKAVRVGSSWDQWSVPSLIVSLSSEGLETGFMILPQGNLAIYSTTMNSEGFGDFVIVPWEEKELEILEQSVAVGLTEEIKTVEQKEAKAELKDEAILFTPVMILDAVTKLPVNAEIQLVGKNVEFRSTEQLEVFEKLREGEWLSIFINAEAYIPMQLSPEIWMDLHGKELLLAPAVAGTTIVLENIRFNRGTAEFADSGSIIALDKLAEFLEDNPQVKIRLEGHTDNLGDPSLNKELSTQRASKIRAYLTIKGITFDRIRVIGQGGSKPVADNSTESGREKNRRVEMILEQ